MAACARIALTGPDPSAKKRRKLSQSGKELSLCVSKYGWWSGTSTAIHASVIRQLKPSLAVCRSVLGGDDDSDREVRISCPDATGLGCDIARLLLDFGLRIMDGGQLSLAYTAPTPNLLRLAYLSLTTDLPLSYHS